MRHAKEMAEGKKTAVRAVREAEKSSAALAKSQAAQARTEAMLRAKHEEVAAAMRKLKEAEARPTAAGKPAGKSTADGKAREAPNGKANLRRWAEHEFNLGVVLVSCRSLLAATIAQRSELQARLNILNNQLGEVGRIFSVF